MNRHDAPLSPVASVPTPGITRGIRSCPRCGSFVSRDPDGVSCLACGWHDYSGGETCQQDRARTVRPATRERVSPAPKPPTPKRVVSHATDTDADGDYRKAFELKTKRVVSEILSHQQRSALSYYARRRRAMKALSST
jgi:ribosomal protein S27AE